MPLPPLFLLQKITFSVLTTTFAVSNGQAISQVSKFKVCYAVCCVIWAGCGVRKVRRAPPNKPGMLTPPFSVLPRPSADTSKVRLARKRGHFSKSHDHVHLNGFHRPECSKLLLQYSALSEAQSMSWVLRRTPMESILLSFITVLYQTQAILSAPSSA